MSSTARQSRPAAPASKKAPGSRFSGQNGAALLAALCFATVLAIALTSYLTLCYRSLSLSSRSAHGTHSIELAETGMEDALWALNKNDWSTWSITDTTATKTISGFTYDNGATGSVALTITNYDGVAGPRTVTANGTTTLPDGTTISRTLTSSSAPAALFSNAVAGTTGKVKFRSAGTVDSYDSTLGDYSTQTPTYSAIISSGSTSVSSATVQLTNAQIKGFVATLSTGPSYSSSARLIGPTTPGTTKIDSSRISTSPYQPIFDELAPSGTGSVLPGGTTTIGTPGATSPALYTATDVLLGSSDVLTVDGPVTLVITGNLYVSSSAKIHITPNGSLEIHLAGDLAIDGNGIQNDTSLAKNLIIIATADNLYNSLEMGTNTAFYGVLYTPHNSLTISNSQAIYGAIVAKSVTFNASPAIHYDLALRNVTFRGIETPFGVGNWRESTNGG